jgi:hypothetical protein
MKKRVTFEKELGQRITIRLDQKSFAMLQDYSFSEGFTPSLIIRHLVKRFLDNQRRFNLDSVKGIAV